MSAPAPFYYNHSQADLVAHFAAIAEEVPAPLVLYNIPRNVKVSLTAETVGRLMEIPSVIGLKDSAGDMAQFQPYLELRDGRTDFSIAQGCTRAAAWRNRPMILRNRDEEAPGRYRSLYRTVFPKLLSTFSGL